MKIYLSCDHRGFELAQALLSWSQDQLDIVYLGPKTLDPQDDFVDYAKKVGEAVVSDTESADEDGRGIVICGSGVGMDISMNKFSGIRSCLGFDEKQVRAARTDDDVNVLALAADFISTEDAKKFITIFLQTPFATEERFVRRIEKIRGLEGK